MENKLKMDLKREIEDSIAVKQLLIEQNFIELVETIGERCIESIKAGGKIIFAGNGGSAADAQHLSAEFVSRYTFDRPALRSIALTTDTSILTAIGNDYGFENLFSRQLEALGDPRDVFIAISTSGNSPNILKGLKTARALGIFTVGFTGNKQGLMNEYCEICLEVPSSTTARIQESHIMLGHLLCGYIENLVFGDRK